MVDPAALRTLADAGGLVIALAVFVLAAIGAYRAWYVPGWVYKQMMAERDEALRELRTASKTIDRLTVQLARERRHRVTDHDPA